MRRPLPLSRTVRPPIALLGALLSLAACAPGAAPETAPSPEAAVARAASSRVVAGRSRARRVPAARVVAFRDSAAGIVARETDDGDVDDAVPLVEEDAPAEPAAPALSPTAPRTRADSLVWRRTRAAAARDTAYRIVVSLEERRLRVLAGVDTLLDAPAGVGKAERLEYAGRSWTFHTPRGRRRVLAKQSDPVWVPPDWHYAEVARDYGFRLAWLPANRPVRLKDGSRLEVRDRRVGIVRPGEPFAALPVSEEIVFDSTLFIPPVGTENRRITGELGEYRLDLGNGYLLHGTPHDDTIGEAATHGCVRLADEDIAWLYDNVPIGTRVYIY